MAQFARPSSDIATNGWTTTPLYQQIDETTYSDTDYIGNNAVSYCEVGLSSVNDPSSSTGHVVRYRYGRDTTSRSLTLVVRLMQGSTEIASWEHINPSLSFVAAEQTLTGTQADSITDYSDLRLRFDITAIQNNQVNGQVSWAEFEIPDVPAQNADSSVSAYLSGKGTVTASAPAFLAGSLSTKSSISFYLAGAPIVLSSSISAYLEGWLPTTSISAYLFGIETSYSSISAYLIGTSTSPVPAVIKIALAIPYSTIYYAKTNISAFMQAGTDEKASSVGAYLLGSQLGISSVHAYLEGIPFVSSSISAFLEGKDTLVTSIPAYMFGHIYINANISAYLGGGALIVRRLPAYMYAGAYEAKDSFSAYLSGVIETASSIHAYCASLECEGTGSVHAYLAGISRTHIFAYLEGVIERVDYIELSSSDRRKRFFVLREGYDDGTAYTSEQILKTISGGVSKTVGKSYTTWSMIIRVPAETNDERYGTRDDLEYFYKLNTPPLNVLSFIDHRRYEHRIIITSSLKKSLVTVSVQGPDVLYIYGLSLLKV